MENNILKIYKHFLKQILTLCVSFFRLLSQSATDWVTLITEIYFLSSAGSKYKTQVSAGFVFSEASVYNLQMAVFSPYLHVIFPPVLIYYILIMFYFQILLITLKIDCFLIIQKTPGKTTQFLSSVFLDHTLLTLHQRNKGCSFPNCTSNWAQFCGVIFTSRHDYLGG